MRTMLRLRRKFALLISALCLGILLLIYFFLIRSIPKDDSEHLVNIQNKLEQLQVGLESNRAEVGNLLKQIDDLQEARYKEDEDKEKEVFEEPPSMKEESKCTFRADAIAKTDIQMLDVYENIPFTNEDGGAWKQGWRVTCDDNQWNRHHKLKVFVVPHSHNDPGWIKTFDEYYEQQTKHILTNMLNQLNDDPEMTMIWAETSYFSKWYEQQSSEDQKIVKNLVQRKQLDFVGGGWVMPDEANSHWLSILQQLTEGHTWLKKNLNVTPKTAWSIDPFGYSSVAAYLLKGAGFENHLIQRAHYEVKKYLARDRHLEFRWRQPWDSTGEHDMFTHLMPFYSYDVPHTCGPDPKVCCQFDFKRLPGYGLNCPWRISPTTITDKNVAQKARLLIDQYKKKATLYRTRALLIPLGDDFRYNQNTEWEAQRTNYQKLFEFINNDETLNVEAKFGTLQEYFDAVRAEKKLNEFPSLSGDFFTYADRDDHYFSGYFTSRPFHKRLDRILMNYLRSAEMLHAWSTWDADSGLDDLLQTARRALSLFQHHDGITGTAREHVVQDYFRQMVEALRACKFVIQQAAYRHLTKPHVYQPDYKFSYFNIDDSRSIGLSENRPTIVLGPESPEKYIVLHNSLPRVQETVVEFLVSKPFVMVQTVDGVTVPSQVTLIWSWYRGAYGIIPQISTTKYRLMFKAKVPPLGLATYIIRSTNSAEESLGTTFATVQIFTQNPFSVALDEYPKQVEFTKPRETTIRMPKVSASFSTKGLLKSISTDTIDNFPVHLEFMTYGVRRSSGDRSGAYLFLPDGKANPISLVAPNTVLLTTGPLESSCATAFPNIQHEIILRDGDQALEIRNLVDIRDTTNREFIMRVSSSIDSKNTFFTDLNGFQYMKRNRFEKIPLQANYYPIPTGMYIEDERMRMTLLTSQPLGGSSLTSGQMEIMQDRRLEQDDNRGLGQGVQDNVQTLNIFKLGVERIDSCEKRSQKSAVGFLTETMHTEMNQLLHPMEKLVWHENDAWNGVLSHFGRDHKSLDIGTEIAVLRNLKYVRNSKKDKQTTIGLVVNRHHLEQCDGNQSRNVKVNLLHVLGIKQTAAIYNANLTMLEKQQKLDSPSIDICPMDIKAFIINR